MLDVIDNWTYAILTAVTPIVALAAAMAVQRETTPDTTVPLEWRGVTTPWTDDDASELDHVLGLTEVEIHGSARG
jgi:hypothetical protein